MTHFSRLRLRVAAVALCLTGVAVGAPAHATSYDLAGLWLFNEGAGQTAYDLSFSGNPGQLGSTPAADANDPSWVQLPRLGVFKRAALHFEGDDYVQVHNSPALEPDGVTVVTPAPLDGARDVPLRRVEGGAGLLDGVVRALHRR